jgi:hypothetical protein
VPEGEEDHGRIAVAMPIVAGRLDQALHLPFGEIFPYAVMSVGAAATTNCPLYSTWGGGARLCIQSAARQTGSR